MKINELAGQLEFNVLNQGRNWECEVTGGYTSDLLSDVMGNADEGVVWITLQTHRNVIAVASLKEVAAVLLINGATPDEETLLQAREEGVCVLSTPMSAFEASGRVYELVK